MKLFSTPAWIKTYKEIYKEKGIKAVFKKGGWKLFALVFMYYLVRDVTLYILIPYLLAKCLLF